MSRFLSIECEWLDQPVAADPLEKRTWARIQINADGRSVTRLLDRDTPTERQSIYVPAFPLARWIATNWWALLYEPARREPLPNSNQSESTEQHAWRQRHSLRVADSGLMLPSFYLYSNGPEVVAQWNSDDSDAYPHMPGQFVGSDTVYLPVQEVESALGEFLSRVVAQIDDLTDQAAAELKNVWGAISNSDADEAAFCRAAGQIGLDPYRLEDWPSGLAELLEGGLGGKLDRPIATDFLAAVDPESAVDVWGWIDSARKQFSLQQAPHSATLPAMLSRNPVTSGYRLAQKLRERMGGDPAAPVKNFSEAASALQIAPIEFANYNHLVSPKIQATVGWRAGREPVVAGPPAHENSLRFLKARALYHAAFNCDQGPRLLTDARTWYQQVSRTFAAELLAPQSGLLARFDRNACARDPDAFIKGLADEFKVSTRVVSHQLVNAGVSLSDF